MNIYFLFNIFLNLENELFQTHPPTKSGKFQIFFFELFLNNTNQIINQKIMTNHSFLQRMTPKLWMVKNVSR